jgi:hypothetical protein
MYGMPIVRATESDDFAEVGGDIQPDSSEVVDFDADTSPAYLLGRLESLADVYKGCMPGACKSSVRKAIALLQQLVSPTSSASALGESYSPRRHVESHRFHSDDFGPPPPAFTSDSSSPLFFERS